MKHSPPPEYYKCPSGYMVARGTYYSSLDDPRLRCPCCNTRIKDFWPVDPEDYPANAASHAELVMTGDELITHLQGEEEKP